MKYPVKLFKSLAIALKEIELFVRNGMHLRTGAPFDNFGEMRSREALANWLLCAVFNSESQPDRLKIASTSDPIGGDGVLVDTMTDETWPTEHVMALVPPENEDDLETRVLAAVAQKLAKGGAAYATGKTLVVFLEGGGRTWHPNRVARALPRPLHFGAVWVVGLHRVGNTGEYAYNVTQMDEEAGVAYVWRVRIAADFAIWAVTRIQ